MREGKQGISFGNLELSQEAKPAPSLPFLPAPRVPFLVSAPFSALPNGFLWEAGFPVLHYLVLQGRFSRPGTDSRPDLSTQLRAAGWITQGSKASGVKSLLHVLTQGDNSLVSPAGAQAAVPTQGHNELRIRGHTMCVWTFSDSATLRTLSGRSLGTAWKSPRVFLSLFTTFGSLCSRRSTNLPAADGKRLGSRALDSHTFPSPVTMMLDD